MELSITTYLIVLPMVFLAAVVDSISGGGGLISLPAYTLAGLDYGMASGCNKFSACFGTLSSVVRYFKGGKILWKPALIAALGALPGAWLGTQLSMLLSSRFMHIFMICATPIVGVLVLMKKDVDAKPKAVTNKTLVLCLLSGLIVGTYDGFFGPGTGTFLILLFCGILGMDMLKAGGCAKIANLASNVASVLVVLRGGQIVFAVAIPAMLAAMLGNWMGSRIAIKGGAKRIRSVIYVVLALLFVRIIGDLLGFSVSDLGKLVG
jgi:uncharacterized membrane protein YfcA